MAEVIVTNKSHDDFTGRHAGVDYTLVAGGYLAMPEEAAHHLFGYRGSDRDRYDACLRAGFHVRKGEKGIANIDVETMLKRLDKFEFSRTKMVVDENPPAEEEAAPQLAPRNRKAAA